jgi:hypothetical protein
MSDEAFARPYPPHEFIEAFSPHIKITPAPEINEWVQQHLLISGLSFAMGNMMHF